MWGIPFASDLRYQRFGTQRPLRCQLPAIILIEQLAPGHEGQVRTVMISALDEVRSRP